MHLLSITVRVFAVAFQAILDVFRQAAKVTYTVYYSLASWQWVSENFFPRIQNRGWKFSIFGEFQGNIEILSTHYLCWKFVGKLQLLVSCTNFLTHDTAVTIVVQIVSSCKSKLTVCFIQFHSV